MHGVSHLSTRKSVICDVLLLWGCCQYTQDMTKKELPSSCNSCQHIRARCAGGEMNVVTSVAGVLGV